MKKVSSSLNNGLHHTSNSRKKPTKQAAFPGCIRVAKRKRNGRVVRLVSINPNDDLNKVSSTSSETASVPLLPRNQYTTTLRRRAVRQIESVENKLSDNFNDSNISVTDNNNDNVNDDDDDDDDKYGDVSLGMKLIVVGGRVIVQSLNSLEDGLASPAQLVGVIQRGDVLLAIGNLSIINLPVDQLMEGLRPLSQPSGGRFRRFLDLRFETGIGMGLLKIHEDEHTTQNASFQEPVAKAMFPLFPMVDQLTGTPLFEDNIYETYDKGHWKENKTTGMYLSDDAIIVQEETSINKLDRKNNSFDALISSTLAKEHYIDRERYESEYFDSGEKFSALLRKSLSTKRGAMNNEENRLTRSERLILGNKVMITTRMIEMSMEETDKGRGQRSFKNWNFRSGNKALDTATDDESIDSHVSLECVDSDKLLLRLAARDVIWRKQVIEVLNETSDKIQSMEEEKTNEFNPQYKGVDLTKQIGNFLFGEAASRNSQQEYTHISFPPLDITRVLFDLTTYVTTYRYDAVSNFGASSKLSSTIASFQSCSSRTCAGGRLAFRADILLAKRFILDEALPKWLKSFRPLCLENRKYVWPRSSTRPENLLDSDSVTIDSGGSLSLMSANQKKKQKMRELLDYQSTHRDIQFETCFLATYYFTQNLIKSDIDESLFPENINAFIEIYGAYLQIHTCLLFAASAEDEIAISLILKIAKHDPTHRHAYKEIQNFSDLLFYDQVKLSALLQSLYEMRYESNVKRRNLIRDLCVSAFPDVQPWQVRKACLSLEFQPYDTKESCSKAVMEDMYYVYLSRLLNPSDGQEAARYDSELVKEFCELSIGVHPSKSKNPVYMENFINIVARSSVHHTKYRRDLMMLLDLSLRMDNEDLTLDLVDEILENKKLSSNNDSLHRVLCCLRRILKISVAASSCPSDETNDFHTLRRVVNLFEKMSCNQGYISVVDEYFALFQQWKIQTKSNGGDCKMFLLVDFLIQESSRPIDVIRALLLWSSSNRFSDPFLSRLEDILRRGIHFSTLNGELSGTLLRLKHARILFKELAPVSLVQRRGKRTSATPNGIWERMATGDLSIEK